MKKTNTWVIYHSRPVFKTEFKSFPTETYNKINGFRPTLLSTGKEINRPSRKDLSEEPMQIVLNDMISLYDDRSRDTKHYSCKYYETVKEGFTKEDFTETEWKIMAINVGIIEFMQRHLEVSYKNLLGEQLNENFPRDMTNFYVLENIDAKEASKAAQTRLLSELKHELSMIAKDPEEFTNLAYQMAIDPSIISKDQVYNILNEKIEQDPVAFEKALKDVDRWFKTVISRALRTMRPGKTEAYIVTAGDGDVKNYLMDGTHLAQGMVSLIGYFKDNQKVFEGLEFQLGLKKKAGTPQTTAMNGEPSSSPEPEIQRNKGGRPPKQVVPS